MTSDEDILAAVRTLERASADCRGAVERQEVARVEHRRAVEETSEARKRFNDAQDGFYKLLAGRSEVTPAVS